MKIYIFLPILLFANFTYIHCQVDTLTESTLKEFNKRAMDLFYQLEAEIVNITNPHTSAEDLEYSLEDAVDYFRADGNIEDLLEDKIKNYPAFKYFHLLRASLDKYYDINKEWQIAKDPSFTRGLRGLSEDGKFSFLYKTEIIVIENFIRTRKRQAF